MIYKEFYLECQKSIPKSMVGTDLYHNKNELKEANYLYNLESTDILKVIKIIDINNIMFVISLA